MLTVYGLLIEPQPECLRCKCKIENKTAHCHFFLTVKCAYGPVFHLDHLQSSYDLCPSLSHTHAPKKQVSSGYFHSWKHQANPGYDVRHISHDQPKCVHHSSTISSWLLITDKCEPMKSSQDGLMGYSAGGTVELHLRHQQFSCKYNNCGQHWRQELDHGRHRWNQKKQKIINCTSGRKKEREDKKSQGIEDKTAAGEKVWGWFCLTSSIITTENKCTSIIYKY